MWLRVFTEYVHKQTFKDILTINNLFYCKSYEVSALNNLEVNTALYMKWGFKRKTENKQGTAVWTNENPLSFSSLFSTVSVFLSPSPSLEPAQRDSSQAAPLCKQLSFH